MLQGALAGGVPVLYPHIFSQLFGKNKVLDFNQISKNAHRTLSI